ncbi:MAG: zinc-dependent metalloprotease [Halioglobus sp.]
MNNKRILLPLCLLLSLLLSACGGEAQFAVADADPSYAQIVEQSEHIDGLLDFYRDRQTGELYLALEPEQLGVEFVYAAKFLDGKASIWTSRGVHGEGVVLTFRRHFRRLEFLRVNVNHYYDPDTAISRSADANRQPSVLAVAEIAAEDDNSGRILARVDPVFLSEALTPIKPTPDPEAEPGEAFVLGEFIPEKSSVIGLRSYPENSQLIVSYVYEDPAPLVPPGASFADPRIVTIVLQHNFLAMPEAGFEPRFADPRVGYFSTEVDDMTSFSATPWRDPIQRWRLVKKNPGAELSEPVEPIVFWLENSTPEALRDEVTKGVLAWNQAFEQAGFRNAIEVKVQPDDADWDAEDIRYNVLRWTASDESPWGGYGPAFTNPRTGEVIGSDIMLEFGWLTHYNRWDELFVKTGRGADRRCNLGAMRAQQLLVAALASGVTLDEDSELLHQSVIDLVMHEVGHTLGLNHNFIASTYLTPQQLQDRALTETQGIASSVMDYIPPNLAPPGKPQGMYFSETVGVYDRWAIEYGYSEALEETTAEERRLRSILDRSTQPGHAFAQDAEIMNDSAMGMDPRVLQFDTSANPVAAARETIALMRATPLRLLQRPARDNATWQEMVDAYELLMAQIGRQGMVASRWIGGIFSDKALQGQAGAGLPLQPVPLQRQLAAMQLLRDEIFAPDAFSFSSGFYQHLQRARRGENFLAQPQAAQLHTRVLEQQKLALDHLLHPTVMQRIADSQLYGNEYSLTEVLDALTGAIFEADISGSVNSLRQQLQGEYLDQLLAIIAENSETGHTQIGRSAVMGQVLRVRDMLVGRAASDAATQAHTAALLLNIERALRG